MPAGKRLMIRSPKVATTPARSWLWYWRSSLTQKDRVQLGDRITQKQAKTVRPARVAISSRIELAAGQITPAATFSKSS